MARPRQGDSQMMRGCPYCGKSIRVSLAQCPFCREAIPEVRVAAARAFAPEGRAKIRRGLLYVLLAGILHYFAAGYSGLTLPVTVPPVVTDYGTLALFLGGFGVIIYGICLYLRS
ncbi:MAG TPA: hypothetical protein VOA78_10585 [Candidatus Dormibacteraeota bacterium]|nr:hypothetical protein [Candidatus Dormibacteraeota bacterium]